MTDSAPTPVPEFNAEEVRQKKTLCGILALVLPGLAIHKFLLGYTSTGIIQIVVTIVTCGLAAIISIIEGIMYLMKSDQEFYDTYIANKKEWF